MSDLAKHAGTEPRPLPANDFKSAYHVNIHIPNPIHKDLPKVNPNAVPTKRVIGGLLKQQNFDYIPNHRPVVEKISNVSLWTKVSPQTTMSVPINPRKLEKFNTAIRERELRAKMGIKHT